jgi:hypothetical protein
MELLKRLETWLTETVEPQRLQELLEQLARWRLACGDLPGAARWQRLAIPPHQPALLQSHLHQLLHQLGETPQKAPKTSSWRALQRLLHRGHYRAARHQQSLLLSGAAPPPELVTTLVAAWLKAGRRDQVLELVRETPQGDPPWLKPEQIHDHAVAAGVGWLLLPERRALALLWCQRSLAIHPRQPVLLEAMQAPRRGTGNGAEIQA